MSEIVVASSMAALAAAMLLATFMLRRRRPAARKRSAAAPVHDMVDTVVGWPPEPVRVMTAPERLAHDILRQALPGHLVLAQVPLSRFLRVPTRYSYAEWMTRVGMISADLVLCDGHSQVLAVVDIRPGKPSRRTLERHLRLERVLKAADVPVLVWIAEDLPSMVLARTQLIAMLEARAGIEAGAAQPSGPMPLFTDSPRQALPAAEPAGAPDSTLEPVPSMMFEDLRPA